MTQSYNSNPVPHRAPRRARKLVAFYGQDFNWLCRLVHVELKMAKKTRDRKLPGTKEYAAAVSVVLQCEAVLGRMKNGKLEWIPEIKSQGREEQDQ